ncbi:MULTISPECIES: hypothetical protein [Lacrimispora]|jgi:hypothetical protein|uniref:hypothetical protein n=1 Tax=Lacrimispora TaxID=2719231 RepID=UPI000BE41E67|nr:hypothetical protein [Lacrimispora amygdalina]MDK2964411.1 hypothetical protein [Lacrimispora sp.]
MNKEIFSKAIGEIDTKYINEALKYTKSTQKIFFYKKTIGKTIIAAVFFICLLLGVNILYPFNKTSVLAYAYETNEKISSSGTVLSTGKLNADGSMTGTPLSFYIKGNDIKTIRYSVKNQWIDFIDWTQKREEFGVSKNFTVNYGSDQSDYYYLIVNWEPNELWEALSNKNTSIKDLPQELLEDTIVLEISYRNGKTESKAIKIKLQDNGDFVASFVNYTITEKDDFVNRPDSDPIDRSILYTQGSDAETENKTKESKSYKEALTAEELEAARTTALNYYKKATWGVKEIKVTENTNSQYSNENIESEYDVGDIIIFNVTVIRNNENEDRFISVARNYKNNWTVINEGF